MDKFVISVAVTGAFLSKEQHPALPVTPEEIRDEVKQCYDAGATVAHLHARHPDRNLDDYKVFSRIVEFVNESCPIITQLGTGVRSRFGEIRAEEERLNFLEVKPVPDMMTINAGTFHFRVLSKKEPMDTSGRSYIYNNSQKLMADFARGMHQRRIGIEFECFDAALVENVIALRETGVLPEDYPLNFNFILAVGGGMPATPKALMYLVDAVPPRDPIGRAWPLATTRLPLPRWP